MKVTRGDVKFEPVTLVLETQAEVDLLVALLGPVTNVFINQLSQKLRLPELYWTYPQDVAYEMYDVLEDFATNGVNKASSNVDYTISN